MTIQQFDIVHKASPFKPFTIHMGDGRSFFVRHRDFLARSPTGRTVIVYDEDDNFSILDLLLMTELDVRGDNGQRKKKRSRAK